MLTWKPLRLMLLATTFSGVLLVLIKSVLYPATSNPKISPFVFPPSIPLQGWQDLPSYPLIDSTSSRVKYFSGRHYRYIQNAIPLDIKMRYSVGTDGDIKNFIKNYESMEVSPVLRHKESIGFYGLFIYQGKAYLSACINPYGGTTVTERQFKQNRNAYDLQLSRLLPWLLGQENLKDERCLWAHLSVPFKDSSPELAYQSLEKVWYFWYQWWLPRFPKA